MMNSLTIALAKNDLEATKGAAGSGTVACRLWHSLHGVIEELEKHESELAATKAKLEVAREALKKAFILCMDGRVSFSLLTKSYLQEVEDMCEAALQEDEPKITDDDMRDYSAFVAESE